MKILKQIIETFRTFVDEHPTAYDFAYGPISDIQGVNREFPIVWCENIPSKMYETYTQFNFQLWILNLTNSDKKNLEDIMSDMSLIGRDIMVKYKNSDLNDDFEILDEVNMEPVSIRFDDLLSGWIFTFSIVVDNNYC